MIEDSGKQWGFTSRLIYYSLTVRLNEMFTAPQTVQTSVLTKMMYTEGKVTSQSLWSRYDRHFMGMTWHSWLVAVEFNAPLDTI